MADKKISQLTNITGANVNDATDELAIVDASTNTTNAITRAELFKGIDGNVGIGTSSPRGELDLGDGTVAFNNLRGARWYNGDSTTFADLAEFPELTTAAANVRFLRNTDTTGVKRILFHRGDGTSAIDAEIGIDGGDTYFTSGNVGIGTSSPSSALTVQGNITGTAVTQSSTDTTGGRLLKVGDFGVGAITSFVLSQPDGNDAFPCGFYGGGGSGASNFPGASGFRPFLALNRRSNSSNYMTARIFIDADGVPIVRESLDSGATWSSDNVIYGTANLLGTVSQSGGDPTGAVIERGSNANGEYVRFADGTQICTHAGLCEYTGSSFSLVEDWSFPALFYSRPTTSALAMDFRDGAASGGSYNGSPVITLLTRTTGNNTLTLYATGATWVSGDAVAVHLQATGRWF